MPTATDPIHAHVNSLALSQTAKPIVGKSFSTGPHSLAGERQAAQLLYGRLFKLAPPQPSTPQTPAPPQPPRLDSIVIDWAPITFPDGTPVGGRAHVVLYPDGRAVFSGHMHDSGAPSYDYSVSFAVVGHGGSVFTISHAGSLKGTFDSGSRSDDWTEGIQKSALAAAWNELSESYSWNGSAGVNWTVKQTVEMAIEAAKAAAAIGSAVKSVVALF